MTRIHILGASGCGVTTLGNSLAKTLKLPQLDCDAYYWQKTDPPFQRSTPVAERQRALLEDLRGKNEWIVTGSMDSWSEPFEPLFTHVIFLFVPREERVRRLKEREKLRWGERVAQGGDMHDENIKFIEWAWQYEEGVRSGRSLPRHEHWLARQKCPVLRIEGVFTQQEVLERALAFLG